MIYNVYYILTLLLWLIFAPFAMRYFTISIRPFREAYIRDVQPSYIINMIYELYIYIYFLKHLIEVNIDTILTTLRMNSRNIDKIK
jgi:hypothetical protein